MRKRRMRSLGTVALGGVTLIELLTALLLIGVLGAIAVPGFAAVRRNAERTAAVNDLFHAVFLARSEAIKRGEVVSVCRTVNRVACAHHGEWSSGWMVFVNSDRDEPPQRAPAEPILAVYEGWAGGRISSNRAAYSFRPQTQGAVNGTILFCDPRGAEHSRAIIISHTGRPRIARTQSNGKPLPCPGPQGASQDAPEGAH